MRPGEVADTAPRQENDTVPQAAPEHTQLPPNLAAELERNELNPCVGQILLSESEKARVWYIRLAQASA